MSSRRLRHAGRDLAFVAVGVALGLCASFLLAREDRGDDAARATPVVDARTPALAPRASSPLPEPVPAVGPGESTSEPRGPVPPHAPGPDPSRDPISGPLDLGDDAKTLKAEIGRLASPLPPSADPRLERRASLLERFLDRHPTDPEASELLRQLVSLRLTRAEPSVAEAAVERHAARIGLDEWRADKLRASVAGYRGVTESGDARDRAFDEARRLWERVASSPAPPHERVEAKFWIAHSYVRQGKGEEGRRGFEEIVSEHGADPSPYLKNMVDGARKQLEDLDRARSSR